MVKKIAIFPLAAILALCLFSSVFAEIKYFQHIQADVPIGWTALEQDDNVIFTADDKSAVITVTVQSAQGASAERIAAIISKSVNGTAPVRDDAAAGYFFDFVGKGAGPGKGFVKVDGPRAIVVAVIGDNPQVSGIIESLSGQVDF